MSEGTLLRNTILRALCTPFPTTKQTKEAAATLVNAVAAVVTTQTFIAHTAVDLDDEEMEVITPTLITTQQGHTPFLPPIHLMEPAPPLA